MLGLCKAAVRCSSAFPPSLRLDTALQIERPKLKISFCSCSLQIHPEKINGAPKASVGLKLSNMNHKSVLFLPCMVLSCCPKPGGMLGIK